MNPKSRLNKTIIIDAGSGIGVMSTSKEKSRSRTRILELPTAADATTQTFTQTNPNGIHDNGFILATVPEPSSLLLLLSLGGLGVLCRRKRKLA